MKMRKDNSYSNANVTKAVYTCDSGHLTTLGFSPRVRSFPRWQECRTCFKPAQYTSSTVKINRRGERVIPRTVNSGYMVEEDIFQKPLLQHDNGEFTASHYKALFQRRTKEELESLLERRLAEVRQQYGVEERLAA